VFFGVLVAGGGAGAAGWSRGGELPGDCGECWGFEEFGARGGELADSEETANSEQSNCDGYA